MLYINLLNSVYLNNLITNYSKTSNIPMKSLVFKVYENMVFNHGYSHKELVHLFKSISSIYSNIYIDKTIKANTVNIPTPEKLPEYNLFIYNNGLFISTLNLKTMNYILNNVIKIIYFNKIVVCKPTNYKKTRRNLK